MAWTKVRNRNGDLSCRTCPSWLRHWENGTNQLALMCGAYGCRNMDVIGAQVIKVDGLDHAPYIVPICTRCSASTGELDVFWDLYPSSNDFKCKLELDARKR